MGVLQIIIFTKTKVTTINQTTWLNAYSYQSLIKIGQLFNKALPEKILDQKAEKQVILTCRRPNIT